MGIYERVRSATGVVIAKRQYLLRAVRLVRDRVGASVLGLRALRSVTS